MVQMSLLEIVYYGADADDNSGVWMTVIMCVCGTDISRWPKDTRGYCGCINFSFTSPAASSISDTISTQYRSSYLQRSYVDILILSRRVLDRRMFSKKIEFWLKFIIIWYSFHFDGKCWFGNKLMIAPCARYCLSQRKPTC